MAILGPGNFDRDDALNELDELYAFVIDKITRAFTLDSTSSLYDDFGESYIVANIDILATLGNHYGYYIDLDADHLEKWKQDYLTTFDHTVHLYYREDQDRTKPDKTFIQQRRKIVEDTFDRLIAQLRKHDED